MGIATATAARWQGRELQRRAIILFAMSESIQKYKTIADALSKEIAAGKFGAGKPFPSETMLMRRFAVARHTVLRALDDLRARGLIVRRQGKGTFLTRKAKATGRIALIVHGSTYCEIFSPIVREVSHLCATHGRTLLLADVAFDTARERATRVVNLVEEYMKQGVDGVLFQPLEMLENSEQLNERICTAFDKAGVPLVLIDSDIVRSPSRSRYDLVGVNHFAAGRAMAAHLRDAGARRVAYLMQRNRAPCVLDRHLGVKTGCDGLPLAGEAIFAEPDDKDAIRRFLRRNRPDAIACYNDRQAVILVKTLAALGKHVPNDIRVAGFDDVNYATLATPRLTTIHQPCAEIASTAFDLLISRIGNPSLPPREVFLPAPLVVRESTK